MRCGERSHRDSLAQRGEGTSLRAGRRPCNLCRVPGLSPIDVERPNNRPESAAETDDLLMVGVQQGRVSLLGVLFERHQRALLNFFLRLTGNRETSDDLVQEVFLRMLRYRSSYRPQSQFRTWMYHLARNVHIDRFRSSRGEVALIDLPEPADPAEGVTDLMQRTSEARAAATGPPEAPGGQARGARVEPLPWPELRGGRRGAGVRGRRGEGPRVSRHAAVAADCG
jgi:Sigma-70 region 2